MQTESTLRIVREFDASRGQIWEAWANPDLMMLWHGPEGFTCPSCTIDFQVGGKYLSCMQAPDGKQFWSTGTYKEIIPFYKIVCTDSFADKDGNIISASDLGMPGDWPRELLVTVLIEEDGDKTIMTLTHEGVPKEMQADCETGWNQSLDKLAAIYK